nr:maleylpyruvate isomerase N-terminal domain-containing protein [Thermobispora bispora]
MDIAGYLGELDRSGRRLAEAAKEAGLGAPVPTCPGWLIRDLLRHTGGVHRWATAFVSTGRAEPYGPDERRGFFTAPPDDGLLDWYLESHAELVRTLKDADPDLECWAFLPAPSPLAFWARRQAHETAIHRVDAELAAGHAITPFDPAFAADGSWPASTPGPGAGWSPTLRSASRHGPPTTRPPGPSGSSRRGGPSPPEPARPTA